MTGVLDGLLAAFLAMIWNLVIILALQRLAPPAEARFLVRLYMATLALRYALAVFLNANAAGSLFAATFWGDSGTYDVGGDLLARRWAGELLLNRYIERSVSGFGFYYVVGVLYFIFGRNQLLVQFLNGTIGAVTMLVMYAVAAQLFDRKAARWVATFMAFFPQMIFWSSAMYKDPAIMLCLALSMYAALRMRHGLTVRHLVLFVATCLALMTLRFYVFYFVAFATMGTYVFTQRRGAIRGVFAQIVLVGAFAAAFGFAVSRENLERQTHFFDLKQLQVVRSDQAMWGRSAFAKEGDVSTVQGALQAVPKGLLYLLFAPFPWATTSLRQALTVPETLVWYALMPAFYRGFRIAVARRLRESLPILVFTLSLTLAYALFQGNIGTAYRQRAQISMFFFVFMGLGLSERERSRGRRPVPETMVMAPAAGAS